MSEFQYLNGGNSEAQDRLATSYLLEQSSVGLARTGVLAGLAVSQTATASGSVKIGAGAAVVQTSVLNGAALLVNDTLKTLDIFTENPMGGLPRNDIVVFENATPTLTVIIGVPNATPDDPTVPATACALARLRHAASATTIPTAKIDDLIVLTGLAGTEVPTASVTVAGKVELATSAETVTGTDTSRATTPASVNAAIDARTASATVAGIVELDTVAEAVAGLDTVRAVTAAGVAAAIAGDAWATLPLVSANYAAAGGYPVQFRVSGGWCELRGLVVSTTTVATAGDESLVGVGFAPAALGSLLAFRLIAAVTDNGGTLLSGFATLNPRDDGGIRIRATVAGAVRVTLDGLRYRTS